MQRQLGRRTHGTEHLVQAAVARGFDHFTMLLAEQLMELVFDRAWLKEHLVVGSGSLADAAAAHEYLGFQQALAIARFTLDVVKGVVVFNGRIEAEDHGGAPCPLACGSLAS